jgi:uncharacterized membrane protein
MRDFNLTALISGIVFIILGTLFLFDRLGVLVLSSRYVWPIVLVAVGIAVIAGSGRRHHRHGYRYYRHDDRDHPDDTTPAS